MKRGSARVRVPWEGGLHNVDLEASTARLLRGQTYRDLSTVCIIPTRPGISLHHRFVQALFSLIVPMNQRFFRFFVEGREVGDAYSIAIDLILGNPVLSQCRYLLTIEDDNVPPPDGLLKLYESIEGGVDGKKYDVVQGLYWTKGLGGQPMIYGDPAKVPGDFVPQVPRPETVQPARGLGMGFNLWRLSMFKDPKISKPLFRTVQEFLPGEGTRQYTQDLWAFQQLGGLGYRFACDTRVKVGHADWGSGEVW